MSFSEEARKLFNETDWPVYICSNVVCTNKAGDINYEIAWGIEMKNAPQSIKCPTCGSNMKLKTDDVI